MSKLSTQTSKLLPLLFQHLDEERAVTVLHVGLALPETVEFFSNYRCKLHFIDVFPALPIIATEEPATTQAQQFRELLPFSSNTVFDICLFWDLFNFLDAEAIQALFTVMRPHLKKGTLAHAFSVHNRKAPQKNNFYGIQQLDALTVRDRQSTPHCYAPHSQRELTALLDDFRVERSVLLPDSRLELLLLKS
ncbi:MAG: hypothetical protein KDI33_14755 [Halioglobus sp.]|nr:hypothetical protein [Halioglobus sp.]